VRVESPAAEGLEGRGADLLEADPGARPGALVLCQPVGVEFVLDVAQPRTSLLVGLEEVRDRFGVRGVEDDPRPVASPPHL